LGIERRWLTLIAVCGATFVLLVDITIVQVALPTIQHRSALPSAICSGLGTIVSMSNDRVSGMLVRPSSIDM